LGLFGQRLPCGVRGAAEADGAQESILRNRGDAEDLRQPALPDPPLELHLPQSVLGMDVSEAEERIEPGAREDVRDRVGVANDFDWRRNAGDRYVAVDERQRASNICVSAGA